MALDIEEIRREQLRKYPTRPTDPVMPRIENRPEIGNILNELAAFQDVPVDVTPLERVSRARATAGKRDFLAGMMMAGKGGEELHPLAKSLGDFGLGEAKPLRVNAADEAFQDPDTGEVIVNPFTQQKRLDAQRLSVVDKVLKEQTLRAQIAARQGEGAAKDISSGNKELMDLLRLSIADRLAEARVNKLNRGDSGKPAKPISGLISPEGSPVFLDPETRQYVDREGNPVVSPMTTSDFGKRTEAIRKGDEAAVTTDALIKEVDKHPGSFGTVTTLASVLPSAIRSRVEQTVLSDEEQQTRAQVMSSAAAKIHELTGAALAIHEGARLDRFIPKDDDDAPTVLNKLKGARAEYDRIKKLYGKRATITPTGPKGDPSKLSDDDLLKKYPGKNP